MNYYIYAELIDPFFIYFDCFPLENIRLRLFCLYFCCFCCCKNTLLTCFFNHDMKIKIYKNRSEKLNIGSAWTHKSTDNQY